mgnify:FL=1
MERLTLWLVGPEPGAFSQYIPGNFRALLGREDTVCVGAVYGAAACGAALAQREQGNSYCLRYIFVDPRARLCGLGTYLLRGLLGQLRIQGAREVRAVYSPSMLEDGRQTLSILERAGFSRPKPAATSFSTRLGDIPDVDLAPSTELEVYSALDAPKEVRDAYLSLLKAGELPDFSNMNGLTRPWGELSSFCTERGALSGALLIDHKGEGCHLAGLYVLPEFRGGRTAAALIARSIQAARALLPPETEVWASAIDRNAFSLCNKLLRRGNRAVKETELCAVYVF